MSRRFLIAVQRKSHAGGVSRLMRADSFSVALRVSNAV